MLLLWPVRAKRRSRSFAKNFGRSVVTLKRWIAVAEGKETGAGPAAAESAEIRELKKRNRLLEQQNEILRRAAAYLARDIKPKIYPLVTDLAPPVSPWR